MNKNRWTIRKDPSYLAAQAHPTSTGNPTENRLLFSLPLNSSAPGVDNAERWLCRSRTTSHHSSQRRYRGCQTSDGVRPRTLSTAERF
jgi:hypothetical protein